MSKWDTADAEEWHRKMELDYQMELELQEQEAMGEEVVEYRIFKTIEELIEYESTREADT